VRRRIFSAKERDAERRRGVRRTRAARDEAGSGKASYAALGTRTGRSFSSSRWTTSNGGGSVASPGRPRGAGMAEETGGMLKYRSAGGAQAHTWDDNGNAAFHGVSVFPVT
jgi:hypothetical protein